jgi:exonuclease III
VSKGTINKMRNKKNNTYNIATWNVRSMYEGKLDIVREEMKRLNIDILGISEMKWTGKGHFGGEKDKVMYSGCETHKRNGVGMIITKQVEKSLIGYKVVNDRIMYVRVEARPVILL